MNAKSGDMIVNLTTLPECPRVADGVRIHRPFVGDKERSLYFIRENFHEGWTYEAERAILQLPSTCLIAVEGDRLLGFSCYDATAKGFFGPIGVAEAARGKNIGAALLVRTLEAMRDAGYGYAIIGWVGEAAPFYRNVVGADFLPNSGPENSVYSAMLSMGAKD